MLDDLIQTNATISSSSPNLVLFVDIGGTRELESLVALLPWLQKPGNLSIFPRLIVVKSEKLFEEIDINKLEMDKITWVSL